MRSLGQKLLTLACYLVLSSLVWPGLTQAEELLAYLSPGGEGYWQVWVLEPTSGKLRQVSHSEYDKSTLSWYPDNKKLLINGLQGELANLELATGEEFTIDFKPELKGFFDATLSPDGKYIAFSIGMTERKNSNDIWVMGSDGARPRKLTNQPWYQIQPGWSMDGQELYYSSGKFDENQDIWSLNLDTGDQLQLTQGQRYHLDISVATDGRLLFSSNRGGHYDIWVRYPDARTEQLTNHEALDANPVWSPGGKGIVFESSRSGRPQLYALDINDSSLYPLTHAPLGSRYPRWSKRDKE